MSRVIAAPLDSSDGSNAVPIGPDTPLTSTRAMRRLTMAPLYQTTNARGVLCRTSTPTNFSTKKFRTVFLKRKDVAKRIGAKEYLLEKVNGA
jgi:hypothetical protein